LIGTPLDSARFKALRLEIDAAKRGRLAREQDSKFVVRPKQPINSGNYKPLINKADWPSIERSLADGMTIQQVAESLWEDLGYGQQVYCERAIRRRLKTNGSKVGN
jgi:hypothetical protein